MAEINDFGEIQNGVEHISEVLDSMRAQNAMNAGDMDKVLANINSRLETLSNEENSDLIKVFLAELKRSLEERHNFVSSKFVEIESSFKTLVEHAGQEIKADELRQVFEIIANNLTGFSKDVVSQKELLTDLNLKLEDLKQDDSAKKDILKNISVLKIEIEKFNNGFESLIVNINDSFKEVSQILLKIDSTEVLALVKKDIENIFLSSNAVLSALQVIDRKNRDLEEVLNHVVTKEDFVLERDQVANLISQNIQLTDYISKLPTQDLLNDLTHKVDTAVGVINALKNVLNETSDQNQKMLVAQLDNLEAKIVNISTEEEFVGFRKELSSFAQEVIQSTNLMRADLMNTNSELKELASFLTSMDIKNTLEHFAGLAQTAEDNIKIDLSEMSENFSKETEQTRNLLGSEVKGSLQTVTQKLDSVEKNIVDSSKTNFGTVMENIQSVLGNIFALKNEIKVDNLESSESFDEKLKDLREDLVASKDAIVINSQQNLESTLENIQILSGQLELARDRVSKGSEVNVERILSTVTKISSEISLTKQTLSQGSQENLENILSNFEQLSQELAFSKSAVMTSSQENFGNVLSGIDKISQEVLDAQKVLGQDSRENLSSILSSVALISEGLSLTKEGLSQSSKENFDNILLIVEKFAQEITVLKESLNQNSQFNFETLKTLVEELSTSLVLCKTEIQLTAKSNTAWVKDTIDALSQELQLVKEGLESKSQMNFENITDRIEEVSAKIEEAHSFTNNNLAENISQVQSSISTLPAIILENQAIYEDEKRVLIEQNSRNIEELVAKIQSLTKGIISKDNPFKEEVLFEFANLNTLLASVNEDSAQKNAFASEEIKSNIQGLESLISQFGSESEVLLHNLQTRLSEYLQLIQNTTQSGDLKLENSLRELFEIKAEILSVSQGVSALNADTRLGELSREVNQKLEGILLNITQLEEISSLKNQDNLQKTLTVMDEQFEKVITSLDEHKSASSESSGAILENLTEKLGEIKEQFRISSTAVAQIVNSRTAEISNGFVPIKEAIEKIAQIDFEKIVVDVKDQLDEAYIVLTSSIKENLQEDKAEVLEKISQTVSETFYGLNIKLENLQVEMSLKSAASKEELKTLLGELSGGLERVVDTVSVGSVKFADALAADNADRKDFLGGKFEEIESSIFANSEKNVRTLENTIKGVIEQLQGLNSVSDKFQEVVEASKERVIERLNNLETSLVKNQNDGQISSKEEVFEKMDRLEATIILTQSDAQYSIIEKIESKFEEKNTLIRDNFEEVSSIKYDILAGIDSAKKESIASAKESFEEISSLKYDLLAGIDNAKNESISSAKESFEEISSLKYDLLAGIDNAKNESIASAKESFDEISSLKYDLLAGIDNAKNENISLTRENLEELVSLKSDLLEGISNVTSAINEENSGKIDYIKSEMGEILNEIGKAQEGLSSYKLDIAQLLKIKDEDVVSQFSSIENTILEGISQNVEDFKSTVAITALQIEDKISLSEENYKTSTQALLGDIKSSFYSKVEENLDDLKSFMEVLENRTDYNVGIDNLKSDVFERFSILADDIETSVSSISVKKDLDALRTNVETSISELLEGLYDRIVLAIEDDKVTQDVLEKSDEIARRVEDLKRVVAEDVCEKLDGFGLSIEKQADDFSNVISEVKAALNELKETYIDLSLNSNMEVSSLLTNVQDKIDNVSNKLDSYDFDSIVESATSNLMQEIVSVKENFAKFDVAETLAGEFEGLKQRLDILAINSNDDMEAEISEIKEIVSSQNEFINGLQTSKQLDKLSKLDSIGEEFQGINQKLDVLAVSSNDDLESDISQIKESILSQKKFIEDLKSLERLDKLSKLDGVVEVQEEIKKIISEFSGKLNTVSSQKVDNKDQSSNIKEELKGLKSELIESVLNIFDQISFVVEAEEIKDFVEEKSEEIKGFVEEQADEIKTEINHNIKSALGNNFDDILSSLDILHDRAKSFDGGYSDIKNEITDVKKHLQSLQNIPEDSEEYSYTFQDIESDIAKVRLILNEISQSKSEPNFDQVETTDKLSEDIMSISNRTNKLLLTSEESNNTLKVNLDEFRNIVYNLEEKVRYLDSTEATNRIEKELKTVNKLVQSSVQSDKIFNQAFMYLAQWVDTASEDLASITEKVEKISEIQDVKQSIAEIKKTVSKKTDLTAMLDAISDKFEQQQIKIERLEEKIDELASKKSKPSSKLDIEAIVAEVLAQVTNGQVKADTKMTKKVDSIDKQLTKLSKNIEKLTSYVDQE